MSLIAHCDRCGHNEETHIDKISELIGKECPDCGQVMVDTRDVEVSRYIFNINKKGDPNEKSGRDEKNPDGKVQERTSVVDKKG